MSLNRLDYSSDEEYEAAMQKAFGGDSDPLKPSASLLVKIGSLVVHYQEMNSPGGHHFDKSVIEALEQDAEVSEWFQKMDEMAMLPKKRN